MTVSVLIAGDNRKSFDQKGKILNQNFKPLRRVWAMDICATSKDNLDSQSGIPVNLWSSKVNLRILLHISISS